jgi:hypothetical protein
MFQVLPMHFLHFWEEFLGNNAKFTWHLSIWVLFQYFQIVYQVIVLFVCLFSYVLSPCKLTKNLVYQVLNFFKIPLKCNFLKNILKEVQISSVLLRKFPKKWERWFCDWIHITCLTRGRLGGEEGGTPHLLENSSVKRGDNVLGKTR